VTQGPDIKTPGAAAPEAGGGTVETREPGKTGEYGWTEKAGLSRFKSKDGDGAPRPDDVAPAEGNRDKSAIASRDDLKDPAKDEKGEGKKRKRKKKKSDAP
jgi:hypothetical protein